ncbi:MAG: hypothetical protein GC179_26460 [Anaerolineaceae bacterium]|nr:hypothetical protein [Anaerolineaceae bacterium]
MGFTLELLPNEPIIVTKAKGVLVVQDFIDMFSAARKLMHGMQGPIYRISDFTEATSSFMELLRMAQIASKGNEGTTSDPRIKAVLVGTNQWIALARTIFEQPQYSAMRFPTFETTDDALSYVRSQLSAKADTAASDV